MKGVLARGKQLWDMVGAVDDTNGNSTILQMLDSCRWLQPQSRRLFRIGSVLKAREDLHEA